jgi:hypothetical protein
MNMTDNAQNHGALNASANTGRPTEAQAVRPGATQLPPSPQPAPLPRRPRGWTSEAWAALGRHVRKCCVCHHQFREEIEEFFVDWELPYDIAIDFKVPLRALYRHAHAVGLVALRQGNIRAVLDRILERSQRVDLNGDTIIRAVRAYTCLGRDNKWTEPPTQVIYSTPPRFAEVSGSNPTEPTPARSRSPRAPRSRKSSGRKRRVLIDNTAIRNQRISLKTRGRR